MYSLPWGVVQRSLNKFYKQNCVKKSEIKYWRNPHQSPEYTDRSQNILGVQDSNETNYLCFLGAFWNQIFLALSNLSAFGGEFEVQGLCKHLPANGWEFDFTSITYFQRRWASHMLIRTLICNCTAQKIMPSLYSTSLSLPMFCQLEKMLSSSMVSAFAFAKNPFS